MYVAICINDYYLKFGVFTVDWSQASHSYLLSPCPSVEECQLKHRSELTASDLGTNGWEGKGRGSHSFLFSPLGAQPVGT